jgi:hypothetical protein
MSLRLRAIYKEGAFIPIASENLEVPENTEVELIVSTAKVTPPTVTGEDERHQVLKELLASWDKYPVRPDAPSLTRDDLHERG